MSLPFAPSSVSMARKSLKAWLEDVGTDSETIEDARIVVSELVGNSVRHAQPLPEGDLVVAWQMDTKGLLISVTDGGSGTRPRTVGAPSSALAGRGMAIVDSLAVTWWADKKQTRSTVHAVLSL